MISFRTILNVLLALVVFKVLDKMFLDEALSGIGKYERSV